MAQSTVPTWEGMELEEDKDLRFEMKLILTLWFDGLDEYIKGRLTKALMEYRLVKQLAAEATAAPQTEAGARNVAGAAGDPVRSNLPQKVGVGGNPPDKVRCEQISFVALQFAILFLKNVQFFSLFAVLFY